jgi:hypothetical protein
MREHKYCFRGKIRFFYPRDFHIGILDNVDADLAEEWLYSILEERVRLQQRVGTVSITVTIDGHTLRISQTQSRARLLYIEVVRR